MAEVKITFDASDDFRRQHPVFGNRVGWQSTKAVKGKVRLARGPTTQRRWPLRCSPVCFGVMSDKTHEHKTSAFGWRFLLC